MRARGPRPAFAIVIVVTATALSAAGRHFGWANLWLEPDQRGRYLLEGGRPAEAADAFQDPTWRGIAHFRAADFTSAAQDLAGIDTAVAAYDRGNALVMLGKYADAISEYDRALRLDPKWRDADANRAIARLRAARLKAEGGVKDDTESEPDQVVYDKTKKGGQDTNMEGNRSVMSDEAVRSMWLKRVQTRPADFLRARFTHQLEERDGQGGEPPR